MYPVSFAAGILLLFPFAHQGLAELQRFRQPRQADCIGSAGAPLRIVYLHGRDTYGPSWVEQKNRETLRALAQALDARIALPRVRGGWPKGSAAALDQSRQIVARGAQRCFAAGGDFGLIGFSDGANLTNELYLQCRPDQARWFVSVGSEGEGRTDRVAELQTCGRIAVVAGAHEPTYLASKTFARKLARREADARFLEHPGVHELPFSALRTAIWSMNPSNGEPAAQRFVHLRLTLVLVVALILTSVATAKVVSPMPRRAWVGVLVACTLSMAVGRHPGLFTADLTEAFVAILFIGVTAGALTRFIVDRRAGYFVFFCVLFAAVMAAVWQVAVPPLLASIIVQH